MAISVFVEFSIKDGQLEEFADYLKEMIRLTKLEDGCIAYDLYKPTDGSKGCVLVEIWETQEKLDKHMVTEHFQEYIPGCEKYQDAPLSARQFIRI